MSCGVHVAHRGQLLRSLHPTVRQLVRGMDLQLSPADTEPADHKPADLRGGAGDDRGPVDAVADTAILFTVSYFSTALFLALGADDLLAGGLSLFFYVATRYLRVLHRAAFGAAGRVLAAAGALRGLLLRRPGPAADHPAARPAHPGRDRDEYRDYFWNGHWLPF